MQTWQMQEAKARMSELVKRAQTQPQDITLHGKSVAVVISRETFDRLSQAGLHAETRIELMSWVKAVESTVTGLGYELVDCERSSQGLLRVYIDRLPGGAYDLPGEFITVDDCEKVTRQLQYALEVGNVDYSRLEVSSPGLDRPLRTAAHFERFAGNFYL